MTTHHLSLSHLPGAALPTRTLERVLAPLERTPWTIVESGTHITLMEETRPGWAIHSTPASTIPALPMPRLVDGVVQSRDIITVSITD